jgi:nucleotide-binding universal stress UspA family protein
VPEGEPQEERWAVLFRPEQLTVAARREELSDPALGEGVVEEVRDLGALRRLRVRLEGVPGAFPLGKDFGESGLPLGVLLPTAAEGSFRVGERVWVGARGHHVLPQQMRRLLVLADATSQGRQTLTLGTLLARGMGASAKVLCLAEDEASAQRLLESVRESPGAAAAELTFEARSEHADRAMEAELDRGEYDLVVLSGAERDSAALARRSHVSVLVARSPRPEIHKVLLCTAAGEPGKLDVLFGAEIARSTGAAATLLYVEQPSDTGAGAIERVPPSPAGKLRTLAWIGQHLEQGRRTLSSQGVSAEPRVRRGEVLEEILAEATEGDYDLIVVGGHRRRTWFRTPERDLPADLLARADRPVLVVKES